MVVRESGGRFGFGEGFKFGGQVFVEALPVGIWDGVGSEVTLEGKASWEVALGCTRLTERILTGARFLNLSVPGETAYGVAKGTHWPVLLCQNVKFAESLRVYINWGVILLIS